MAFDSKSYLGRATSRAKSDVANKLVSMFLHDLSRRISVELQSSVTAEGYRQAVIEAFGHSCAYCERVLEDDRAAVEHLDGMNRFRAGLHIPGNVVVSCKRCNSEKRRDDSRQVLHLATSGWESFLSHDGSGCEAGCKTCLYWKTVWPNSQIRSEKLSSARIRIASFRAKFKKEMESCERAGIGLKLNLEALYRDGQEFAKQKINQSVATVLADMLVVDEAAVQKADYAPLNAIPLKD
jgi:hypothetical protein